MKLGENQTFASPGEALEHHGVKGMRWGVRKKDDSAEKPKGNAVKGAFRSRNTLKEHTGRGGYSPRTETRLMLLGPAAALDPKVRAEFKEADRKIQEGKSAAKTNQEQKGNLTKDILTEKSNGRAEPKRIENEKAADHHGLTTKQKKVLVGLGVTAGVAGYIAYKHYTKEPLIPGGKLFDPRELAKRNISKRKLGDLAEGHHDFTLLHPEKLHVDVSKGYADIRPIGGFANQYAEARHTEMIEGLDRFREMYPSIRNMNLEVVPLSHQPGFGQQMAESGTYAAVLAIRPGEARIFYNDLDGAPTKASQVGELLTFPGMSKKGALGAHEMGHLLAVAGGRQLPFMHIAQMPTGTPSEQFAQVQASMKHGQDQAKLHKELFKKHGLTYGELKKLSPYAASMPEEALAELSRYYHGPKVGVGNDLTPETRAKAKALFDDLGGVNVDSGIRSRVLEEVA